MAADYGFSWGWRWPYPETSGYIIPSLFDFARQFPESELAVPCRERAIKIADWLTGIQLPGGGFISGLAPGKRQTMANLASAPEKPSAFETAQIMLGLLRAFEETDDKRYLEVAARAGDWLVGVQQPDGSFTTALRDTAHAFDACIAWPLAALWRLTGDEKQRQAAEMSVNWYLKQQRANGYFDNCSHTRGELPWTHAIGYTMQGLLEAGELLESPVCLEAVRRTAEALLRLYFVRGFKSLYETRWGFLPARLDQKWHSRDHFSYQTGSAQVSLVWSRLHELTGDVRYLNGALKLNEDLKSRQDLTSGNSGIRGGIKGSHPIYGLYATMRYPNWAAKFFVDALIAEEAGMARLRRRLTGDGGK